MNTQIDWYLVLEESLDLWDLDRKLESVRLGPGTYEIEPRERDGTQVPWFFLVGTNIGLSQWVLKHLEQSRRGIRVEGDGGLDGRNPCREVALTPFRLGVPLGCEGEGDGV